jgi:hypothetical protein
MRAAYAHLRQYPEVATGERLALWRALLCAGCLATAGLAVATVLCPRLPFSYDTDIMMLVTQNLLKHRTFRVPWDGFNGPYSTYGLGLSLIFAVPYWLADHLRHDPISWMMAANTVVFALTVAALFWLTISCGATAREGAVTSVLVGLGTLLLPYAVTGLSEPAVGLAVALGLAALAMVHRQPALGGASAGFAAGLAVLMRADSLLLVAPFLALGVWLLGRPRRVALPAFAAGAAPWTVAFAAYNVLRFGAPWRLGYGGLTTFDHPLLTGLYGLTLSPVAGILWYAPLVAVAALGVRSAWRRLPGLTVVALALFLVRLPFYGTFWAWTGGTVWGPRYLAPAMPVLALGVLEVVRAFPRLPATLRVAVPAIAAVSLLVQIPGALIDPRSTPLLGATAHIVAGVSSAQHQTYSARPDVVAAFDVYYLDWRYFPIVDETHELLDGKYVMSRHFPHQGISPADVEARLDRRGIAAMGTLLLLGLVGAWFVPVTRRSTLLRFLAPGRRLVRSLRSAPAARELSPIAYEVAVLRAGDLLGPALAAAAAEVGMEVALRRRLPGLAS